MPRNYSVGVSPAAVERMYDHFEFVARVSVPAADDLLGSLVAGIETLHELPERNPVFWRKGLPKNKYRYLIVDDRYRIVYQVTDGVVHVDDIQDCRQADDKNLVG